MLSQREWWKPGLHDWFVCLIRLEKGRNNNGVGLLYLWRDDFAKNREMPFDVIH